MGRTRRGEGAIRRRVGRNIEARRAAAGIDPARLAEAAEVDDRQMKRVLRGESGLSFYSLARVAAVLGCTPGEILNESVLVASAPRRAAARVARVPRHPAGETTKHSS